MAEQSHTHNPNIFKRKEAAAYCRMSNTTFYRIGPEPDLRIGHTLRWQRSTLDNWLLGTPKTTRRKIAN